jgi:hypothetical protein
MYDLSIRIPRQPVRRVRAASGALRKYPGSVLLIFDGGEGATASLSLTHNDAQRLIRALQAALPAKPAKGPVVIPQDILDALNAA